MFKDAIKRREKTLEILNGPKFEQIKEEAKANWIEYRPTKNEVMVAGIDSSFNSVKFQGAEMWAVTAVSINSKGYIISDLHDFGLGNTESDISSMASKMEIQACGESIDISDLVLMDGSLYSQFMTRQSSLIGTLLKVMKKNHNVVFVSKTSNTRAQFEKFNSIAGDIFYFNHATNTPGFSKLFKDPKYGKDKVISSTYVRLSDSLPLIKIELLGDTYSEEEIKTLLNKLYKNSVGGYPYALKLAHNNCKITGRDLAKLVSLHGLSTEIGSREVLE
ncbi:MAG: DNA double-strand break repair nuclease NurA [Nitrosopumilaceae archaeon]